MNFLAFRLLSFFVSVLMLSSVYAQDGTFNFKGEVTNSGCTIDNPNLIYEGYTNLMRWVNYERTAFMNGGPKTTVVKINCGNLTSIPKVRFSAETGIVLGPQSGKKYLGTTGTASNIGWYITWSGNASELPAEANGDYFLLYGPLYSLYPEDKANGIYHISLFHDLRGMKPYDDSNNGTFESVLGYELIYN